MMSMARSTGSSSCAAAHDQAGRRDDAVGALPPREPGIFFNAVDRKFRSAAEDRENRAVPQEVDGIVTPFAGRHLAAVETEDASSSRRSNVTRLAGARRRRLPLRPRGAGSVRYRRSSCGASFRDGVRAMIAPERRHGKRALLTMQRLDKGKAASQPASLPASSAFSEPGSAVGYLRAACAAARITFGFSVVPLCTRTAA